jgi:hypothetical protein
MVILAGILTTMQSDGEEALNATERKVQPIRGCPILAGVFPARVGYHKS